jgi:6-phosphogluconolactonase
VSFFIALLIMAGPRAMIPSAGPDGAQNSHVFYIGTYTGGNSQGIYQYILQEDGRVEPSGLAARSDNPSFLARSKDGKYLVAVSEIKNESGTGTVESYRVARDTLLLRNRSSSGGAHPCHVSVNDSGYVLVSNYSGGNVGLLHLDARGTLSELLDVKQHTGSGTTDRQRTPHAHSAKFGPGTNSVIAADLGTNELWFYNIDPAIGKFDSTKQIKVRMAPGAGPRHFILDPDNQCIYVVNELDCTVTLIRKSLTDYQPAASYSTLPENYTETNYCADIHISSDGRFLYASNRGHNSIVIFRIEPSGGSLEYVGHEAVRGDWPRNFSISPDGKYLLVANQRSNNIVSFRRDREKGTLEYIGQAEAPSPVCILFNEPGY